MALSSPFRARSSTRSSSTTRTTSSKGLPVPAPRRRDALEGARHGGRREDDGGRGSPGKQGRAILDARFPRRRRSRRPPRRGSRVPGPWPPAVLGGTGGRARAARLPDRREKAGRKSGSPTRARAALVHGERRYSYALPTRPAAPSSTTSASPPATGADGEARATVAKARDGFRYSAEPNPPEGRSAITYKRSATTARSLPGATAVLGRRARRARFHRLRAAAKLQEGGRARAAERRDRHRSRPHG